MRGEPVPGQFGHRAGAQVVAHSEDGAGGCDVRYQLYIFRLVFRLLMQRGGPSQLEKIYTEPFR